MSRSKAQGTRWEGQVKLEHQQALQIPVVRLAEEGMYDRGDLAFTLDGQEFVLECRDRSTMEVHKALAKARVKAGMAAITAVVWKRKLLQPGNQVRTQVGPPVVIVAFDDWLRLLQALAGKDG